MRAEMDICFQYLRSKEKFYDFFGRMIFESKFFVCSDDSWSLKSCHVDSCKCGEIFFIDEDFVVNGI